MNKNVLSLILFAVAIGCWSCSSGNNTKNTPGNDTVAKVTYDNALPKSKVMDSLPCINSVGNTYALYLPSSYTPSKAFPCIYFFDAHARGALPLRKYKALAERYGFVLVGSDFSKNGIAWAETDSAIRVLMENVRTKINIDPKRIYTAGFSGGSRVASSIAIFDGGVAGVIGCAAGFPGNVQEMQHKFNYFGMVGEYDFNLTEMQRLDEALAQNGFVHQLLTFNGKHGWPEAADFETAWLWMQVNAIKANLQPKDNAAITALKADFDNRISAAQKNGDWLKAYELLVGAQSMLDGVADIASYKKQLSALTVNERYKNAVALRNSLQQTELAGQQQLAQQFTTQNAEWWAAKITELNRKIKTAKTPQEAQMYQRLLNYLGLVSYMNCNHAIMAGDLSNAITYLHIFKMADPQNPDCPYLGALYYMKKGAPANALIALTEAASLGYSDVSQLTNEAAFASLHNDVAFINVVKKVRDNYSSAE